MLTLAFASVLPITVSAQSIFSGGAASVTTTSAATSTITVTGATGTVKTVSVELDGVKSDGSCNPDGTVCFYSLQVAEFLLKGPGGAEFVLLGSTGDGEDGCDGNPSQSASCNGLQGTTGDKITIVDTGAPAPYDLGWLTSAMPYTVKPSSYWDNNLSNFPPLPGSDIAGDLPQTDGCSNPLAAPGCTAQTLNGAFLDGLADGTWTLTLLDNDSPIDPFSITGWKLTLTYNSGGAAATTTSISPSANPATYANSGSTASVNFTATVSTASSGAPTGTVAFSANGATISGCGAVTLAGSGNVSTATCTGASLAQGNNTISAAYTSNNTGSFGNSSNSMTELVEVTPANPSGNQWCNNSIISDPLGGAAPIAYPSVIQINDAAYNSKTVSTVTVNLEGVAGSVDGIGGEFLLVAPGGGTHNLDFFDSGFGDPGKINAVNLTFEDLPTPNYVSASTTLGDQPTIDNPYSATDDNANGNPDTFPSSTSPSLDTSIPQVPGTLNFAPPYGTGNTEYTHTNVLTFGEAFNGAPANGAWSLYTVSGESLTVNTGWCITLALNTGNATTTVLSSSSNPATTGSAVTFTATVTSGGNPVTSGGTVTFLDNDTTPAGATGGNNVVTLNGSGVATFTTSSLTEGDHTITASYGGTTNDNSSYSSVLNQRINTATTVTQASATQWQFCDPGAIQIQQGTNAGPLTPNPSNIFVTNLPGTYESVGVQLTNFSVTTADDLDELASLVEGPTGTALDFFSNTTQGSNGTGEASLGNYVFDDGAGGLVSSGNVSLTPGSYKPTAYESFLSAPDVFTSSASGFYPAPSAFSYAPNNPLGTSQTFADVFPTSINPDGTWSLFFSSGFANKTFGAANGWCVDLTVTAPVLAQPTLTHVGNFAQGESNAQYTVDITNNGPGSTGDPSNGTYPMKVSDTLPTGLTYSTFSGTNWSCSASGQTVTCTNESAIAEGDPYPALTIDVNISGTLTGSVTNQITAGGAGAANKTSNTDTAVIDVAPAFTSGSSTTFTVGTAGSFTVTATGTPAPTFSETGNLPNGVTLSSAGLLSGTPAAGTGGSYPIILTATNGTTNATQDFTLTVVQAPAITSANATSFASGSLGTFTVTTSGSPTSALSESGPLPSGVTFVDHGNGTATISGTANLAGSYLITITAQNGILPNASQSFTLTVNPGVATHLVIPGGPEPFYTAFNFTITAEDAFGNVATSYNGTVAFTSSDPGFVNLGPVTLVNGQGSQTGVLKTAGTDSITATDTTNSSITGTGFFTIQPGPATHIGLVAPPSTYAGSPISVTLTAYDLYGNVATSYGGTVVITSSDPSAILPGSSAITNGTGTFSATMETTGSQTITATDAGNSLSASTGSITVTIPTLVVTTASDDSGAASNCTIQTTPGTGTDASCSLRDALLETASLGSAGISFDSTKFATAQTITLGNGTLTIPSNASINGPTSGTGATVTNLVTVNGAAASSVFTVASGTISSSINSLIITGGSTGTSGGGVSNFNGGTLTINNSTISGNSANGGFGGGMVNTGTLALKNSTISGNSAATGQGGGIFNSGTLTVTNSTIAGNAASGGTGGGIMNTGGGTLTVNDSTISGNSATGGGGIYGVGTTVNLANSIVSGNTADADIDGGFNDNGGNQAGVGGINLAPLASYGGPTQTMPALPGSPAICFGTLTNWNAASLTADQRGFALLSTYCPAGSVDSGAVQTDYALAFTTEPPATANAGAPLTPAPVVTLTESGSVFAAATSAVTITDADSGLSGGTNSATLSSGTATFTNLILSAVETGDTLTASLSLNPSLSPALVLMSQPSTGITVSAQAALISPTPGLGTVLGTTNVTFQWSAGAGITEYQLNLGTTGPGSDDLFTYRGSATSVTLGLPANGVTIYARLSSLINGTWLYYDYLYTESPTPSPATLTTPTPGLSTVLGASNVSFQWTPGSQVALYQLSLSAIAPGQNELFSYDGTATSVTVPTLPAKGQVVYARLASNINGVWQFSDYQYTESGSSTIAVLTSPTPGLSTVLGTSDVTFQWSPGTGATEYQLNLGTGAAGAQNLFLYKGAATSVTVPSLPANGQIVYARLYSQINGTWVYDDFAYYNDYAFTESGSPAPAVLQSPSPGLGTVLGTSDVPFHWSAGTGATLYQFSLSAIAPGASDLYLHKGTATSATVTSLPANGVIVYATLSSYINGAWQSKNYVYTETGTTVPAVLQSPTPGLSTILGTSNVAFQWSAGTGVTLYELTVSAVAPGGSELYFYKGSATAQTVPTLPANGAKVYARLYSYINNAWVYSDYVYTEQ
ncbi:MAG: Ig-like domain-containing protein [Terracidiphilus sp.]